MTEIKEVSETIDQIIRGLMELKKKLRDIVPSPSIAADVDDSMDTFEKLKIALTSDRWPEAVNTSLICDPTIEADKVVRGRGVIELIIEEEIKGKKFLDFGCGEGHCVNATADFQPSVLVGYDAKSFASWESLKGTFTDNWDTVVASGPYDIILMYDIIDHVENETPIEILAKARSVLSPQGKIYMRCHPWVSRHGCHYHHELNKAFVHLVFTEEELKKLGTFHFAEKNIGVTYPLKTYETFANQAGLKIVQKRNVPEKVEPFFKIPKIAERIMQNTKTAEFPEFQMGLSFLDLQLGIG